MAWYVVVAVHFVLQVVAVAVAVAVVVVVVRGVRWTARAA
jgi:hypothetical protein